MNVPFRLRFKGKAQLLFALAGILGGCLGGPAPEDHFYRLELPAPEIRFDQQPLKGTLQVTRPWADALISERHLLYRETNESSQLHRYGYHQWVDSPTLLLQQEIARYLRASHVASQVVTPEFRTKVDYVLSCRIAKLERVLEDPSRVVMELELGITQMKDRQALLLQSYQEEQPASGDGISASIVAYNQALSNILNRFLEDASEVADTQEVSASP